MPVLLSAQTPTQDGQEYSILGPLFGEQTFPRLSLTANGGYIVWQDNAIDGQGLGIGAQRLDSAAFAAGSPFLVNKLIATDQAKPCVTILNGGNALFAWQSGRTGFPVVYARLLGTGGQFLTGDVRLSATSRVTRTSQTVYMWAWQNNRVVYKPFTFTTAINKARYNDQKPAAASLADGGAVVVYSGIRSDVTNKTQVVRQVTYIGGRRYTNSVAQNVRTRMDWMREVYFQRLSAAGAKLGAEVLVNQVKTFNQRDPSVAVLRNGSFVVVWVSEEGFLRPLGGATIGTNVIVVKGRLYGGGGAPLGNEFRIDGDAPAICAYPAVSASADGGFTMVWNQVDRSRTNRWDIYGRTFTASGVATLAAFRINTRTYGDQLEPKLSPAGANQLVVWTSLGHDGSREGVFGRLLSGGLPSGEEFLVNTTTRFAQRHPCIASSGNDRFVVAWESFTGLASGYDLMGQKFAAAQPPPAPAPPSVTPLSQESLLVAWPEVSDPALQNYELFVDGAIDPVSVPGNSWVAGGFAPLSTHSFRLAYLLDGGGRSALSEPASGTTLDTNAIAVVEKKESSAEAAVFAASAIGGGSAPRMNIAVSDKGVTLRWNTEAGGVYQVQMSTNLSTWQNLGAAQAAFGPADYKTVESPSGPRFFRVMRTR